MVIHYSVDIGEELQNLCPMFEFYTIIQDHALMLNSHDIIVLSGTSSIKHRLSQVDIVLYSAQV